MSTQSFEEQFASLGASVDVSLADLQSQIDAGNGGGGHPDDDQPPPIPDRAGHTEIWRDEFEGNALDPAKWGTPYSGTYKSTAGSKADPKNVEVSDGRMWISSYWNPDTHEVVTGGLKSKLCLPPSGGWMEACFRQAPGMAKTAIMLYPRSGWPPEIDYFEIGGSGGDRQSMNATVHYSSSNKTYSSHDLKGDYTSWTICGVRYGGGRLAWTLDGVDRGTLVTDPNAVPTVEMFPIFQTECGPSSSPVDPGSLLEVAWMRGLT